MEETNIFDNQESLNVESNTYGESSSMVANSHQFDEPLALTVNRLEQRIAVLEALIKQN